MFNYGHICMYVVMTLLGSTIYAQSSYAQNYAPGEVIVKLKNQRGSMSSYAFLGKAQSDKQMTLKASYGKMNLHHFSLSKGQSVEQAIYELAQDPDVEYVEPNYYLTKSETQVGMLETFSAEEVESYASQTKEVLATDSEIGLAQAWQSMSGNHSQSTSIPIVAVIDSGLDMTHDVFQQSNSIWVNTGEIPGNGIDDDGNGYIDDVNGWNFIRNTGQMFDDDGHGTHVAGIVLSVDQNIFTGTRTQAKIRIMPLKFLDGNGSGTTSAAIQAIYYAVNNGATVLNNSWGGSNYSSALHDAVAFSYERGVSFIAAAGNSSQNNDFQPMYPASYDVPNVISVGATNSSNYLASFSNFGVSTVHLGSPGTNVNSTIPNNRYALSNGTSMAAPFVAGAVAQMKVNQPTMLGFQLKNIIMERADRFSQLNGKVITSGKLNISASLAAASGTSVQTTQPAYKVSYLGGTRGLASGGDEMAGCGIVKKLGSSAAGHTKPLAQIFITLALLLLPLVAYQARRIMKPQSRRRHDRYKIDSEVRISVGDRELVGSVSSISLGGAQVNTAALLEDGGMVTMLIESPDGKERIEVGGRVVWSEANKAYGVAFDQAPQSVLHRITEWTRGLQKT